MGESILNRCKGICKSEQFKKLDTRRSHRDSYRLGYSRCRRCSYYIKGERFCPCCKTILSIKPRNVKHKRLLNERLGIKRY